MLGGTMFHFVDGGIEEALERAFEAADGADVGVGGGAATVQQYLRPRLIDELHLVIVPILLGGGERLFDNLAGSAQGCECVEFVNTGSVAHVRLSRAPSKAAPGRDLFKRPSATPARGRSPGRSRSSPAADRVGRGPPALRGLREGMRHASLNKL
jgi:hypothetical protein